MQHSCRINRGCRKKSVMPRRLIAFLIALLAIAFAFASLAAIRWPSIVMFLGLFFHPDPSLGLEGINWRQLGFAYGAPYFLASLCFYASAASVGQRSKGGFAWYLLACCAASPSLYMVKFDSGWWMNPTSGQGIWVGGAIIVAMLGFAVFLLRHRRQPALVPETSEDHEGGVHLTQEQFEALMARRDAPVPAEPQPEKQRPRRRGPVPAAIARQRAQFAADGRRMLARQGR